MSSSKTLAVPGEFAGVTEEIAAGENTFEDNGAIYTATVGFPVVDKAKRTFNIKAPKTVKPLARGDVILGIVREIFDSVSQVEIIDVEGDKRTAISDKTAFLRVSEIDTSYVESIRDYIRIGDVIRAKVIEVTDLGTKITIAFPEYGVVQGRCTKCRGDMDQNGYNFTCTQCGSKEQRKAAQVG